jgi:hypothetical protein
MQRGSAETRSTSAHSHTAQSKLDDRYLTEDVGYTMVFLTDLRRQIDVLTPIMDGIIEINRLCWLGTLSRAYGAPWRRAADHGVLGAGGLQR